MICTDPSSPSNACDLTPLEQDLSESRQVLIQSQRDQQTAEINIRQGEARIKALENLIGEFNTIIGRYRDRYQQLRDKQELLEKYCTDEKACFEANLGSDLARNIKHLSGQAHEEIKARQQQIEEKEKECIGKKNEALELKNALNRSIAQFDQFKKLDATVDARHKQLDAQKQAVQSERSSHNYNVAYYLLVGKDKYCATVAAEPKVLTVDELCLALKDAWANYKEKDEKYNAKDAETKACEKELSTLRNQLEQDKRDLETLIRRRLAQLGTPAASAAE